MEFAMLILNAPFILQAVIGFGLFQMVRAGILALGWVRPGFGAYSPFGTFVMGTGFTCMGVVVLLFGWSNWTWIVVGCCVLAFFYGAHIETQARTAFRIACAEISQLRRVKILHLLAMENADEAESAARRGDELRAQAFLRKAFELERQAAEMVAADEAAEPTRSVLLRSAASLALDCHEYREAERLIATALAGNPPEEICEELRDLLEKLYAGTELRRASD